MHDFFLDQQVHFGNVSSFGNGIYNMSWMYNSSTDRIYIAIVVRARGWVAFGFANKAPNNMNGYDVAVGGVYDNGACYLKVM